MCGGDCAGTHHSEIGVLTCFSKATHDCVYLVTVEVDVVDPDPDVTTEGVDRPYRLGTIFVTLDKVVEPICSVREVVKCYGAMALADSNPCKKSRIKEKV